MLTKHTAMSARKMLLIFLVVLGPLSPSSSVGLPVPCTVAVEGAQILRPQDLDRLTVILNQPAEKDWRSYLFSKGGKHYRVDWVSKSYWISVSRKFQSLQPAEQQLLQAQIVGEIPGPHFRRYLFEDSGLVQNWKLVPTESTLPLQAESHVFVWQADEEYEYAPVVRTFLESLR